jgi:hypothetical protein
MKKRNHEGDNGEREMGIPRISRKHTERINKGLDFVIKYTPSSPLRLKIFEIFVVLPIFHSLNIQFVFFVWFVVEFRIEDL